MKTMKTTKILMMFSVAAIGLAAVGCDSTTTCADGGVCPDAGAGGTGHGGTSGGAGAGGGAGGATVYGISAGTYCFDITSATPISDGCSLFTDATGPVNYVGMKIPVTYVTTGQLTVGTMGALGTGLINNNQGTLLRENDPIDKDVPACTWHQTDQTLVTVTATNTFTANITETESAFTPACAQPAAADPCTSTFTFTLAIHAPALMPDATTGLCPP